MMIATNTDLNDDYAAQKLTSAVHGPNLRIRHARRRAKNCAEAAILGTSWAAPCSRSRSLLLDRKRERLMLDLA